MTALGSSTNGRLDTPAFSMYLTMFLAVKGGRICIHGACDGDSEIPLSLDNSFGTHCI